MGPGGAARLLTAALAAAAAAWGCSAGERPPNVVLVTLDTVRADHVSSDGYPLPTTPSLDALAAGADRYTRAVATAPWTTPSHASIFTGLIPSEHGAHAGRAPDGTLYDVARLPRDRVTLAEVLRDAGYLTAAFVANDVYLSPRLGLRQGFGTYAVVPDRAPAVNRALFAWLDARPRRGAPIFLFVNYTDAHRPYNTAPLDDPGRPPLPPPAPGDPSHLLDELYVATFGRTSPPPEALVASVVSQYDTGIAHADAGLGELLAHLRRDGLLDHALVIVTSDHGEYFGEHRLVEHSKDVYEQALRVPLVVKRPGQTRGRVIEDRISLAAIPQLVAQSLPAPLRAAPARAFARGSDAPVVAQIFYSRPRDMKGPWRARFARERSALYDGRYKLILSSDGANELYDLDADPGEQSDLVARKPDLERGLEARLRKLLAGAAASHDASRPPPHPSSPPSPEERRRLEQLGYL